MDLVRLWFGRGPPDNPGFDLFTRVAKEHPPVAKAIDTLLQNAHRFPDELHRLHQQHDPSEMGWCYLGGIATVLGKVTEALLSQQTIEQHVGTVKSLRQRSQGGWRMHVTSDSGDVGAHERVTVEVDAVVLATGALPRPLNVSTHRARSVLSEDALDLEKLAQKVHPGETVGVVGNSHTGALVAMNLLALGCRPRVYARRPVRLAEWELPAKQYLYTATGLKGIAAAFARQQYHLARAGEVAPLAQHIPLEQLKFDLENDSLDALVSSIGYDPTPLPDIFPLAQTQPARRVKRNPATSELEWEDCCGPTALFSLGIREPDYMEEPPSLGAKSPVGFGGQPCQRKGMFGEEYVGINAMILRANHIAQRATSVSANATTVVKPE